MGARGRSSSTVSRTRGKLEVDEVPVERVGLAFDRRRLVQLGDGGRVAAQRLQAGAALGVPVGVDRAPGHDAVGHPLQDEIEGDGLVDPRGGTPEVRDGGLHMEGPACPGVRQQVGDVDAEFAHELGCREPERLDRTPDASKGPISHPGRAQSCPPPDTAQSSPSWSNMTGSAGVPRS